MKRILFGLVSLLIFTVAYGQKTPNTYVLGGISYPLDPSDYNKYFNIGFHLGAGYEERLSFNNRFSGFGEFNYIRHGIDGGKFIESLGGSASNYDFEGGVNSTFAFLGGGKFYFANGKFSILAGGGYYRFTTAAINIKDKNGNTAWKSSDKTEGKFGLFGGFQADLSFVSVRGRVHNIFTDKDATRDIDVGVIYYFDVDQIFK